MIQEVPYLSNFSCRNCCKSYLNFEIYHNESNKIDLMGLQNPLEKESFSEPLMFSAKNDLLSTNPTSKTFLTYETKLVNK